MRKMPRLCSSRPIPHPTMTIPTVISPTRVKPSRRSTAWSSPDPNPARAVAARVGALVVGWSVMSLTSGGRRGHRHLDAVQDAVDDGLHGLVAKLGVRSEQQPVAQHRVRELANVV